MQNLLNQLTNMEHVSPIYVIDTGNSFNMRYDGSKFTLEVCNDKSKRFNGGLLVLTIEKGNLTKIYKNLVSSQVLAIVNQIHDELKTRL